MCIATLLLLGLVVDIQLTIPKTYAGLRVVNGLERPGPDYEKDAKSTLVGLLVNSILAYLALWCIKSSFLAFFWRLTSRVTLFRVLWGIAMFLTTCFGVIAIGTLPFYCHIGELNEIIQRCTYGSGARMTIVALKVTCALDIISDVFSKFKL